MAIPALTETELLNLRAQLVKDVTVMSKYALEEGLELDPAVATLVSADQPTSQQQASLDTPSPPPSLGAQSISRSRTSGAS
jgi:hypothetical protein